MTQENTGGRVKVKKGAEVRFLGLDGIVSKEIYLINEDRTDRKGCIGLCERDGLRKVRVHYRRVLSLGDSTKAAIIESDNKHWALCPSCGHVNGVNHNNETIVCSDCSESFTVYWTGDKPMLKVEKAQKAQNCNAMNETQIFQLCATIREKFIFNPAFEPK